MFATEGLGLSKENIKNSRKNAIILKTLSSFRKVQFFLKGRNARKTKHHVHLEMKFSIDSLGGAEM